MKIDFHVHITPPDIIRDWRKIAEREAYFALLAGSPKNRFAAAEEIVTALDEDGLDQAAVFGFSFRDPGLCRVANDYVMDAVRRYPGRLVGFMAVSPNDPGLEVEMDRCMAGGLCGIGELFPDGQDFPIEDASRTAAFAGLCRERRLPVIIHSNEPVGHYYRGKTTTTPAKLDAFVQHNPGLVTIFAHWGGGLFFYELMPELREKYRDVYYDTAASPFLYTPAVYRTAREAGVLDKILLGSDYPLLPAARLLRELTGSGLTQTEQEQVAGGNAARLLARIPNPNR